MAQTIDFKNPATAQKAVADMTNKTQEAVQERKSMFEALMNEIENINPSLGGFEELGAMLALPDEHFALISPIFLDEMQKSMNNIDDKLLLVQAMNLNGTKLEELQEAYIKLIENIDIQFAEVLSAPKLIT